MLAVAWLSIPRGVFFFLWDGAAGVRLLNSLVWSICNSLWILGIFGFWLGLWALPSSWHFPVSLDSSWGLHFPLWPLGIRFLILGIHTFLVWGIGCVLPVFWVFGESVVCAIVCVVVLLHLGMVSCVSQCHPYKWTDSHPWATSILKISFIMAWNVAGKFVRPKNITRGSKRPWGIRNATFHLPPSLIQMLLYPHPMLNFVKRVHPARWSITYGISGDTFQVFFVYLFSGWKSWTGCSFPSAFFMKKFTA